MKINTKIIILISATFCFSLIIFLYIWNDQKKNLNEIHNLKIKEFKVTLKEIIKLQSKSYINYINDNTYWDEMVSFLATKDKKWSSINIIESSKVIGFDYIMVFDKNKNLITYSQKKEDFVNISNNIPLESVNLVVPTFSNFFILINNQIIEIFTAPIQPSNDILRVTSPQGYFVGGKLWDSAYINNLSYITKQKIKLIYLREEIKNDFLYELKELNNRPAGFLSIKLNLEIENTVNDIFREQLYILIICGILLMILVFFSTYKIIIKPLNQITLLFKTQNFEVINQLVKKNDEFGELAFIIKSYFNQNKILNQYKNAIDEGHIISKTDKNGVITYINEEFLKVSGYARIEVVGQKHSLIKDPDNTEEFFTIIWKTIINKKVFKGVIKNRTKNGQSYYIRSVIAPIYDINNQIIEYISISTNVTELFQQMDLIRKQTTDNLTMLSNKEQLNKDINIVLEKSLVYLNIRNFQAINDSFGYEFGDKILIKLSKKLKNLVGDECFLYRISGDEFALLYINYLNDNYSDKIAQIIIEIENNQFLIGDTQIFLQLTVVMASGTDDLRKYCDAAMSFAKEKHISFVNYNENKNILHEKEKAKMLTYMLQEAIKNDLIQPYGQKIFSVVNPDKFKVETLMRIVDKNNVISPYLFLEQAKKARIYKHLTKIMIKKTFEYFKNNEMEFSLNFTFEDIEDKSITDELFGLIDKYNMQNRIIIELVESEDIESLQKVSSFILKAKSNGCKIAIDDFGSGYSNFEYLLNMDADYLKIDGSLIKNIDIDKNSYLIVKTITSLAQELGLCVVAEFIHSQSVQDIVESLGIEYLQGFHLHTPEPIENII